MLHLLGGEVGPGTSVYEGRRPALDSRWLNDLLVQAFFEQSSPYITLSCPSRLPFLSMLLAFLSRHSAKAYHALKTPLLSNVINFCLTSPSPAAVTLGVKSLVIFLVSLPVIIGEHLVGIMAVYGRVVSWERVGELGDVGSEGESRPDVSEINANAFQPLADDTPANEEASDGAPPDPLVLFSVLYGIYPCNFASFLKDATGYLRGKEWKGARGDGVIGLDSAMIRERSKVRRVESLYFAVSS